MLHHHHQLLLGLIRTELEEFLIVPEQWLDILYPDRNITLISPFLHHPFKSLLWGYPKVVLVVRHYHSHLSCNPLISSTLGKVLIS